MRTGCPIQQSRNLTAGSDGASCRFHGRLPRCRSWRMHGLNPQSARTGCSDPSLPSFRIPPMYALEIAINGQQTVTAGAPDRCVLSAGISLMGKLGPQAAPRRDDGTVDLTLRLGGLTARANGATDEHLDWLRADLQTGDVVTIRILETGHADPVISGHEAERMADDERAYFEHCKKAYLEMREKFEPTPQPRE